MNPLIEPGIEPLVSALNDIDHIRTVYSCEGHFGGAKNEKFLPTAYVTFDAGDTEEFAVLYDRIIAHDGSEPGVDYRLTYDCVLGRYTLSIWVDGFGGDPSGKRVAVDMAVSQLAALIRNGAPQKSSADSEKQHIAASERPRPCGEKIPPCALVIPPKEPVCPFGESKPEETG